MYSTIYLNLFFSFIWCGLSNNFGVLNILSSIILFNLINVYLFNQKIFLGYKFNIFKFFGLILFMIFELFKSSIEVAVEILSINSKSNPKVIKINISCKKDIEIMLLLNFISLTPGTLSVDLLSDKKTLLIHAMFDTEKKNIEHFITNKLEKKIKGVFL